MSRRPINLGRELVADVRYALRAFGKTPGLTAIIVLTLALGIGATTAIFSVVNAVLLRPLPYAQPERLVQIVENIPAEEDRGGAPLRRSTLDVGELEWWRANAQTLSDIALLQLEPRRLTTSAGAVQLYGSRVSPALFAIRGVTPLLGRGLLRDEERPDADVIVLGEGTWREHFGADPDVVGRTLTLDGRVLTIVGVMPPEFGADAFWVPYVVETGGRGASRSLASARLSDGVSLAAASAEVNTLGLRLRGIAAEPGAAPRFEVARELDQATQRALPALRVLIAAVAAVLLIVCTNVANLLLVRGTQRQREIAIRRSLGATRGRIGRQVLTECLLLAVLGGLGGVALAFGGVDLVKLAALVDVPRRLASTFAPVLPRIEQLSVDPTVLAFVVVITLIAGAVFGALPALRLSRFGERGHHSRAQLSAASANTRVGHVLATVQLACATTLLIGAGLLLHGFLKLAAVDPGFDPRGVLSFEVVVPGDMTAQRKLEIAETLAARLEGHAQVSAVGFTDLPPLLRGPTVIGAGFVPEGVSFAELMQEGSPPQTRLVSPGYLHALGARLVAGRWLAEPGDAGITVLVSRAYAQRFFPSGNAVGSTLRDRFGIATIVGVVDDIRFTGLETEGELVLFLDASQLLAARRSGDGRMADSAFLTFVGGAGISYAARTSGDPLAIVPDMRAIARDIDPSIAIDAAVPFQNVVAGNMTQPRFYTMLLGIFGAIATFIAVIGIYGVLAYVVAQRTKEIGVRMALGAQQSAVLGLVLRRGAAMVAIGVTAGVLGALGLTSYLESLLYGITALDAATYAVVAVAFAAVALLASYLPARRATAIDPLAALRDE